MCVVVHQVERPPGDEDVGSEHGTHGRLCLSSGIYRQMEVSSVTASIMGALVVAGNQGTTVRISTRMDIPWPECVPSSYLIVRIELDGGQTLVRFSTRKPVRVALVATGFGNMADTMCLTSITL